MQTSKSSRIVSAEMPDYLYRITSFKHAIDLFHSRQLHLVSPSIWSDPFETLLRHKRSNALFAQCWCKQSVSAAMWKQYSPDHTAVRIRTTRSKLKALVASQNDFDVWIRDVEYKTPSRIRLEMLGLVRKLKNDYSVTDAVPALYLKRDAFDYEKEVRMVLHDKRAPDWVGERSLRVDIEPHELIESITFDPQVDEDFYKVYSNFLRSSIQFTGSIAKSTIYRPVQSLIVP